MTVVGVDWGSSGWVSAAYDCDWSFEYHPSMLNVWHDYPDASLILVDIPIGLPKGGYRKCDREAKECLGNRRGSVFWTPPRKAFEERSYTEAKEIVIELTDGSMTTQAWSIMPRIAEVDTFLQEVDGAADTVRESHPEVCFQKLSENDVSLGKLSEEGREVRLDILDEHIDEASDAYRGFEKEDIDEPAPHERRFRTTHRDDVVDAMGLATSAHLIEEEGEGTESTMPESPIEDGCGLPMEIVYWEE